MVNETINAVIGSLLFIIPFWLLVRHHEKQKSAK